MADTNSSGPPEEEQPDNQGIVGDGGLRAGQGNLRMLKRALRDDWNVTPEVRQLIIDQMAKIVRLSRRDRAKVAAAKVILAADSLNAKRERMDQADDHKSQDLAAGVGTTRIQLVRVVVNSREEADKLRSLTVSQIGDQGQLAEPDEDEEDDDSQFEP